MKKILVTGGSGFIGSSLVKLLIKNKYKVYITTKYDSIFDNIRLVNEWDKITTIETDLRNYDSVLKINKFKPDIVFHLAAYNDVKGSFENPTEALNDNIIATSNLLEGLRGYSQFIYISSSEVYGFQNKVPFKESMIPTPVSPYSVGKYAGELYSQMHMSFYKKPIKILRPFNTFGPGQSIKAIIPELIIKSLRNQTIKITKGSQTREFNYVGNIVEGMLKTMTSKKTSGKIMNLGSNNEIKIKDLAELIVCMTNSKSKLIVGGLKERKTEIRRMSCDYSNFKKATGWKPSINFKQGLAKTIDWYEEYISLFEKQGGGLKKIFRY